MSDPKRHPFLTLRVQPEQLELAELALWELGATGIEERDQTTIVRGPVVGDIAVIASFGDESTAEQALTKLEGEYDVGLTCAPGENWATEWRRGFGMQRIGRRVVLHPSWEPVESDPGDVVVTIDPENAFGSGDHETTRLVLELLDERVQGRERILDVGCGSGILSIAALRLGAASSLAIDIERDAIIVAERNAELNDVAEAFGASTQPLAEVKGHFDLVLANIETRVLVDLPDDLQARMAPGGALILSGILRTERAQLLAAYTSMRLEELREEGQWCACVLRQVGP